MPKMVLMVFCAVLGAACILDPGESPSGLRRDAVDRVNDARATTRNCGAQTFEAVPPVSWNATLGEAAFRHSSDLVETGGGGHIGADGSTPETRIADSGFEARAVGEIVAVGSDVLDDVMSGWLASPSHCAVIMSASFDAAGAAVAGARFWTVDFGAAVR